MFKLNLKIAFRNIKKQGVYTVLNITGLSVALATFILILLYVNYESTYNSKIPNSENILLVGRITADTKSELTPAPLGKLIKANFPEVIHAGRTRETGFEFPINSDKGRIYTSKALQLDHEAGKMLHIWPDTGLVETIGMGLEMYIAKHNFNTLFPNEPFKFPKLVYLGPKNAGQAVEIRGIYNGSDEHTTIKHDVVALGNDIGFGNTDFEANNFRTYIQVKPHTNIANLLTKIDLLYKNEALKASNGSIDFQKGKPAIFLDPLNKLHLQPTAGNDTNYKIVRVLFCLGIFLLIIACINFTNLTIAQANSRAKEVGVKKVLGVKRNKLVFQFLLEIAMQCVVSFIIALIIAELALPAFRNLFDVPLQLWTNNYTVYFKLLGVLIGIILISGFYPAWILSAFKPVSILKGNFQTSFKTQYLRNILLISQFCIAILFIAGLLVVNTQLRFMRSESIGFNPQQVVYIKNIEFYNQPKQFNAAREKIERIPGVNSVTVASSIPGDFKNDTYTYKLNATQAVLNAVNVEYDYFETLQIPLKDGRLFSKNFPADSAVSAILNESAVAAFGIKDPIGKQIAGCNITYTVVGVVKDFKAQGFEKPVEPAIYAIKNICANDKLQILINVDADKMAGVLATLKKQWSDINKLDGEDFRYQFLSDIYGKLFYKQEQLQRVFFIGSFLTIGIAVLGLFSFAAFSINSRIKELSIRKVLGANHFQLFTLINGFYLKVVLLANLITWPIIYLLAKKWLEIFAYRVNLPLVPFLIAAVLSLLITVFTVSFQIRKVFKINAAKILKYE